MRRVRLTEDQKRRIARYYASGIGARELGQRYGVSDKTIQRAVVEMGGTLRGAGKSDEELLEPIRQGMRQGYGASAIAAHVGIDYARARALMDEIIAEEPEEFDEPGEYELELEAEEEAEYYRAVAEGLAFDAYYERMREDRDAWDE